MCSLDLFLISFKQRILYLLGCVRSQSQKNKGCKSLGLGRNQRSPGEESSYLTARQAVQTSALSPRWRSTPWRASTWTARSRSGAGSNGTSSRDFTTNLLMHHLAPNLDKFCLHVGFRHYREVFRYDHGTHEQLDQCAARHVGEARRDQHPRHVGPSTQAPASGLHL